MFPFSIYSSLLSTWFKSSSISIKFRHRWQVAQVLINGKAHSVIRFWKRLFWNVVKTLKANNFPLSCNHNHSGHFHSYETLQSSPNYFFRRIKVVSVTFTLHLYKRKLRKVSWLKGCKVDPTQTAMCGTDVFIMWKIIIFLFSFYGKKIIFTAWEKVFSW